MALVISYCLVTADVSSGKIKIIQLTTFLKLLKQLEQVILEQVFK